MSAESNQSKSPEPALEMIDVSVPRMAEPDRPVLEGVNWQVSPGDYWFVGGLHRSGKSDLMALAAGVLRPLKGSYRLFGAELPEGYEQDPIGERLRIGLVFDGGQLIHDLTIEENVALPLCYHQNLSVAEARERIAPLLALVELDPVAKGSPSALSRNRQQRAGLARALVLKPEVLLLDNPLSGLDPEDAVWWLDILDHLSRGHELLEGRGITLVATGDDFRPWTNRPRQFALLKGHQFSVLEKAPSNEKADERFSRRRGASDVTTT